MMPVDWPLAAKSAVHPNEPVRPRSGRLRLLVARADFFLEPSHRLTDEERALMNGLIKGLIGEICDELLSLLPALVAARAEVARDLVHRRLQSSRLLDREGVIRLLLRRSDQHRLSVGMTRGEATLLAALVGDDNAAVADAAMALTIARGHRTDRFGRLGIGFDDLRADDAVAIVHSIAAVLRGDLEVDSDLPLADAARDLLARHDEGRRVDALVEALARALDIAGRATDDMVCKAGDAQDATLVVALLARRGGIGFDDGWDMFTGGDAMMLARIAQCDRPTAAQILATFDRLPGGQSTDHAIEQFDRLSESDVDRYRSWLRLDPHYRDALDRLEDGNG